MSYGQRTNASKICQKLTVSFKDDVKKCTKLGISDVHINPYTSRFELIENHHGIQTLYWYLTPKFQGLAHGINLT